MAVDWNAGNAAHLLRRAGFAARPKDVKKALKNGLGKTVSNLFKADKTSDKWKGEDKYPGGTAEMQSFWIRRMLATSSPLIEKLTLFWHNHFATSNAKVENAQLLFKQNRTLRKMGLGKFGDLLLAMSRDPAMIVWLDNNTNDKDDPNENYARELMELFSTGVYDKNGAPNYTETDIQEAARAFTGWSLGGDWPDYDFEFEEWNHDYDSKTFRGQTGNFDGTDICAMLAADPATARHIAKKLWSFFAYEIPLADSLLDEFEALYLATDGDIEALLKAMFQHDAFYSSAAIGTRIKSPVELLVGTLEYLGAKLPTQNDEYFQVGGLTNDLGQVLFEPPSVFGWDEGLSWVETTGMLERLRLADHIASSRDKDDWIVYSHEKFLGKAAAWKNLDAPGAVDHVLALLGPVSVSTETRDALIAYLLEQPNGQPGAFDLADEETADRKIRGLLSIVIALPEFQRH
jgi:uncharacterized protein (DUF1800 family)